MEFNFDFKLASSIGVAGTGFYCRNGDIAIAAQFAEKHSEEEMKIASRRLNKAGASEVVKKSRPSKKAISEFDCYTSMNLGFAPEEVVASSALKHVITRAYKMFDRVATSEESAKDKALVKEYVAEIFPPKSASAVEPPKKKTTIAAAAAKPKPKAGKPASTKPKDVTKTKKKKNADKPKKIAKKMIVKKKKPTASANKPKKRKTIVKKVASAA